MTTTGANAALHAWVGTPPANWRTDWLKWSVSLSTERPADDEIERLPYIANEDITSWTGKLLNPEPQPVEADSRRFRSDDILFNKLRPYLAKVYHAEFDGLSSGELLCLRPSLSVLPRFLFYVVSSKAFVDAVNAETFGSKMPRADWDIVGHQPLPLPTLDTQQRIAGFLDEKTARIDALIAKKQALLERLAEKRQAIITQAVTKGLNPAAPMKPSGIDWLGEIPAHWGIIPLKWQCTIKSGQVDPTEPPYDEMMLVAPDHIESGTGRLLAKQTASEQAAISGKYLCSPSDVLYSKIRPALRKVALFDEACLCSADMYAVAPGKEFERDFLYYFLLTDAFTAYAELASMRVAMPKVNREALGSFPLPKPPAEEQIGIVAALRSSLVKADQVTSSATKSIEQLTEYRSALITAAVTGQIEGLR